MTAAVTLSTKCWEGDYRRLLDAAALDELFAGFGPAARRQVVLNRIDDRAEAQRRAEALVAAGRLDAYAWAEERWPAVADRLQVPTTWFGAAWPYAVPELVELDLATTAVVAHIAGDVRIEPGPDWLPRAVAELAHAAAVAPVSPSRVELVRPEARGGATGWVDNADFSDQLFVVRRDDLLRPQVVTATHPATGRYPKPGGALTFEARVGAWLRATGGRRRIDVTRGYLHPVGGGAEGGSYAGLAGPPAELPAPVPPVGYPAAGSVPATGVVVARDAERTVGWSVSSLQWLREVVVVDVASTDRTPAQAAAAGARVRSWPQPVVPPRTVLGAVAAELSGPLVLLDGNEVVPPRLAHELADAVADDGVDAVEAPQRTYLFGAAVAGRARWPAYSLRLVPASGARFPWGVEAARSPITLPPSARVRRLPADDAVAVVRLGAADLHDYLRELNDVSALLARGTEVPAPVTWRRTVKRFVRSLARDGGYRAGRAGLRLAVLDALATWAVNETAWDLVHGGAATAAADYDRLAAAVIGGGQPVPVTRT